MIIYNAMKKQFCILKIKIVINTAKYYKDISNTSLIVYSKKNIKKLVPFYKKNINISIQNKLSKRLISFENLFKILPEGF